MAKQQTRVVLELREMILNGEIPAGESLAEIPLAQKFGVSRTPIRHAFTVLEQEGLLIKSKSRSYVVRGFRLSEIADAIEVRGALEGLAARFVAEHGMSRALIKELKGCLDEGDEILDTQRLNNDDRTRYLHMNSRFHHAITKASGSIAVMNALAFNDKVPFASIDSLAFHRSAMKDDCQRLMFAHMQHHQIVAALVAGESARVEALMREHAQVTKQVLNLLQDNTVDIGHADYPALKLISG